MTPAGTPQAPILEVGRVMKAHGVRGLLRVKLHWSESRVLEEVDRVLVGTEGVEEVSYVLEDARRAGGSWLIKLEGVDDMTQAASLRGATLRVHRSDLPELAPGEYYLGDLVGAEVTGPSGRLGIVEEVVPYSTVDVLLIRTEQGGRIEQPLLDRFLAEVDVAARRVTLSSLEGLIE